PASSEENPAFANSGRNLKSVQSQSLTYKQKLHAARHHPGPDARRALRVYESTPQIEAAQIFGAGRH
ncbi:MAG: hypothetical protein ACK463_20760, partial [Bradyrhizobium sp.]